MNLDEFFSLAFLWRVLGIVGRGLWLFGLVWGQGNAFGVRGGISLYQYRTEYAQFFTRLGVEVGAAGHIELFEGRKSKLRHGLAPAFGYLMGHSRLLLDSSIYISPLTGRPLQGIARAHTYTHFIYMEGLWRLTFDAEGALALGVGPQALIPFGQTLMLEYETPDGQPIQEWNRVALSDVRKVIPPVIGNLALLLELRIASGIRREVFLYVRTTHQINRYLWPTGFLGGLSLLWKANPS